MGREKACLEWNGRRAIDLVHDLASAIVDGPVIVSGRDYGHPFVTDPSPFAGPVAGIRRGLDVLHDCDAALVLAVDAPTIVEGDFTALLRSPGPGAVYLGLPLPMFLYRSAWPVHAQDDWPLRRLVDEAGLTHLAPPLGAERRIRGANNPAERSALENP